MSIVNTFSLQSNRQIKINFDGGDLSSDTSPDDIYDHGRLLRR